VCIGGGHYAPKHGDLVRGPKFCVLLSFVACIYPDEIMSKVPYAHECTCERGCVGR
jgi:hypothetical protein